MLWVGEGLADKIFLDHIKRQYLLRGEKTVTVKDAKGKGGHHALEYTMRQKRTAEYQQIGILIDTDAHWNDADRAAARRAGIEVFESTPCLEGPLLQLAGHPVPATSDECKREFKKQFGSDAHDPRVYERYFSKPKIDAARLNHLLVGQLLDFLAR